MLSDSSISESSPIKITRRSKPLSSDDDGSDLEVPVRTRHLRRKRVSSSSSNDSIIPGPSSRKRTNRQVTSSDSDDSFVTDASRKKPKRPLLQSESSASDTSDGSDSELTPIKPRSREARNVIYDSDDGNKSVPAAAGSDDNSNSSSDSESGEKCIICFKTLRPPLAYPSGCNHHFHPDCLRKWSGTSNTCPIDRVVYTEIIIKDASCQEVVREGVVTPLPQCFNDLEPDDPTFCEVCRQHDREHEMLLCDRCEAGYHLDCLTPPLSEVPSDDWFCPDCLSIEDANPPFTIDTSIDPGELIDLLSDAANVLGASFQRQARRETRQRTTIQPRTRAAQRLLNSMRGGRARAELVREPSTSATPVRRQRASQTRVKRKKSRKKRKPSYKVELVTAEDGSTIEVKLGISARYKKSKRKSRKRCPRRKNNEGGHNEGGPLTSSLLSGGRESVPSLDLFGSRPTLDFFSDCDAEDEHEEEEGGGLSGLRRARNVGGSITGRKALAAQLLNTTQRRRIVVSSPPTASCDLVTSILSEQSKWHNPKAQIRSNSNGDLQVVLPSNSNSHVRKASETSQQASPSNGSGGSRNSGATPPPSTSSNGVSPPENNNSEGGHSQPSGSVAAPSGAPPLEPPPQPPRLYDDEDFDLYADIEATPSSKLVPPPEPPAILLAMEEEGGSSPDDHLVIDDHHDTYDPEKPTSPHPDIPSESDPCSGIKLPPEPKEQTKLPLNIISLDEIRLPSPVDDEAECPNVGMYSKASVSLARKGNPSDEEDDDEVDFFNQSPPPPEPGSPSEEQKDDKPNTEKKDGDMYDPDLGSDKSDIEVENSQANKKEGGLELAEEEGLSDDSENAPLSEDISISKIENDDQVVKEVEDTSKEDAMECTSLKGDKEDEEKDDEDSENSIGKRSDKVKEKSLSPKSVHSVHHKKPKSKKIKYDDSMEDGEKNDEKLDFGEENHKVNYDSEDGEVDKDSDLIVPSAEGERDGLIDITDDEISNFESSWEIEERPGKEKKVGLEGLETEAISENEDVLCEEAQLSASGNEGDKPKKAPEANGVKEAEEGEIAIEDKAPPLTWKKLSKGTKERSYREKDTSKEKPSKRSRDKKTKEKRKELERYDVRKLISEKPKRPKKDEFGRDILSDSRSRSRSESRGRYRRSKERRSQEKRSRSRGRSRGRSKGKSRDRSRAKSGERSKAKSRERSAVRSRGKSRSRSRARSRGRSRDRRRVRSKSPRKGRSVDRKKSRKRRRKSTSSCSTCSCSSCEREKRKKFTVIVPNKTEEGDKKSKDRRRDKNREKKRGPRRNRADSPVPSKEVFTSGDNILVSVNFKSSKSGDKAKESISKKRRDDEGRKKKEKRNSKENQPLRSIVTTTVSVPPNMSFQRRDRANLRNLKPVAIIDLDASPFREQTLSPKEIIVLSDSDSNEQVVTRKEKEDLSKAPLTTGPKTPPEPHIKFSISSKPPMRTLANPLLDDSAENEEQEGEEDPPEIPHKGPNTPPEPPVPYDPFEPTKSRSPTPIQEIEPIRKLPTPPRDIDIVSRIVEPPKPISPPKPIMEHDSPKTPSPLHSPPKQVEELPLDKPKALPFAPVPINNCNDDSNDAGGGDSPYSPGSSEGDDLFEPPLPVITTPTPVAKVKPRAIQAKIIPLKSSSPIKKRPKGFKSKGSSSKKEIGIKLDEDQLKILDELPNSAVEMQVKDKFLKKLNRQERVVEEVKLVLKPHYVKKHVTKEEYKEILRKSVPKICHSRSGEINPMKIQRLIEAYVKKYRHKKKKMASSSAPLSLLPKSKPLFSTKTSSWLMSLP